jgi:hypothetical protein
MTQEQYREYLLALTIAFIHSRECANDYAVFKAKKTLDQIGELVVERFSMHKD